MIKMILCSDVTGAIGKDNDLLFHIKEDMEFFKEMTIGHKVVMGYNTWLSLPKKPLPKRENYVLYNGKEDVREKGMVVLTSIDDVKKLAEIDDIIIIGGAMLYNTMLKLDLVDEVYLTLISGYNEADAFVDLFELGKKLKYREFVKELNYKLDAHIYKFYR